MSGHGRTLFLPQLCRVLHENATRYSTLILAVDAETLKRPGLPVYDAGLEVGLGALDSKAAKAIFV